MLLGLFMQPLHDPAKRNLTQMLEHDREVALYIDSIGFSEIWVGEHYSSCIEPIVSPLQFLASIMSETKMKLATGVLNLPQHHPAQVAGDVALLDQMSKGRLIMGVGPGGLGTDFELFNTVDKNRTEMLVESMRMIHEIWSSDPPYNITGKYWNIKIQDHLMPKLGFGPMIKPFQTNPFPEVVVSIMSPNSKSAFGAGRQGWGIASANFIQAHWVRSHWEQYALGCEAAGIRPDRNQWRISRSILVTDTDAEAADYLASDDNSYRWYYDFVADDMRYYKLADAIKHDPSVPDEALTADYCLDTMVMSGAAKTVLDRLVDFVDLMGGPFGGLLASGKEWDDARLHKRSLKLLAEDVMPKLRQHVSTRQAAE